MAWSVTRGGLLVGLAVAGVVFYELRTALGFVGIEIPLVPYLLAVFVLAAGVYAYVGLAGRWREEAEIPRRGGTGGDGG